MILYACAVLDLATNAYGRPIFVRHRGEATRSFIDECKHKTEGNSLAAHPDDYELHFLAEFDDNTGAFTPHQPEVLLRGKDAVQ